MRSAGPAHGPASSAVIASLLTRGDSQLAPDEPLHAEELLGTVVLIERGRDRTAAAAEIGIRGENAGGDGAAFHDGCSRPGASAWIFHSPAGTSCPVQELIASEARHNIVIEVGGVPVRVHTADPISSKLLENRYTGFVSRSESRRAIRFRN